MSGDLYPVSLTVRGLYCFRDESTLELGPHVYAVMARAHDNPARSNWLGKSTLLMAFGFVLFGWHTKKTDDEIVSRGGDEAFVRLELNDGSVFTRSKKVGKSVQLTAVVGGVTTTQDRAQDAIHALIGFTEADFFAVCFFQQKQIAALVEAKSSKQIEIVEGWLAEELEPVQRLHSAVAKRLNELAAKRGELMAARATARDQWHALYSRYCGDEQGFDLQAVIESECAKAQQNHLDAREGLKHAQLAVTAERDFDAKRALAEEYDRVCERGIQLRAEQEAIPAVSDADLTQAQHEQSVALEAYTTAQNRRKELSSKSFNFDGVCPVAGGACPSVEWARKQCTTPDALAAVKRAEETTQLTERTRFQTLYELRGRAKKRAELETKLVELRARATALDEQIGDDYHEMVAQDPQDDGSPSTAVERLSGAQYVVEETHVALMTCTNDLKALNGIVAARDSLDKQIADVERKLTVARDAAIVTGRTGAQQAIQELALDQIKHLANRQLTNANIALQISVSWEQETKGLAKVCGQCGAAFPTSQRVKTCEVCGVHRGPNTTQKLAIEPSDRSGASEDLAGFAFGVATSKWLRAVRGSRWAFAFIDEPFGALDQHNRQALGTHIATMLQESFAGALVVAHQREVLAAMPGRVNIVASPSGSKVEEVLT